MFNAEKTIASVLPEILANNVEVFINEKFYRYAIIQSEKIADSVMNSAQPNSFMYNGVKFYIVKDEDRNPRIWFARPGQLRSLFE